MSSNLTEPTVGNNSDRIDKLNRAFTVIFTDGMQSIKPDDPTDENYDTQMNAWNGAFAFKKELQYYVNDRISNVIGLAGQPSRSDDFQKDVATLVKELNEQFNSDKFEEMMNIAKPSLSPNDPSYEVKMKKWNGAFTFPNKLRGFGEDLEKLLEQHGGRIPIGIFYMAVDRLIDNLEN